MDSKKKLFCFGYGYTAHHLGEALRALGQEGGENWQLGGTTRSREKRASLRASGVDGYLFEKDKPLGDPFSMMAGTTHLLISTPPDQEGDIVFEHHAEDILSMMPELEWVGYLSTTGVYGDRDGAWVDETSPVRPSTIRGTRRARAENQWLSLFNVRGLPVHIFRLAGIYGPGRCALDSVRGGIARRIMKPGHAFCRVHVEDIVTTLINSMHSPKGGSVYNVADDEPAPSHEVIAYASRLLGVDPPPLVRFEDANLAPITISFYSENKSVRNQKIKNDLGVKLAYPNYRVGLEACLEAEQAYIEGDKQAPWIAGVGPEMAGQIVSS
ncbi:MAG: SDR family oxidoreductase [Alphaproteobacteria bacterium]|nr:SDR family oxidoreductase [Alphaproteobacteria bacterium]